MSKFSEQGAIVHDLSVITVGALAALDAVVVNSVIDATREEGFRILKTEYFVHFEGKTTAEGPVMFGFAANLNAAEIEEAIEADPQQRADDPEMHNAMRPVWVLGVIPKLSTEQDQSFPGNVKGIFNPRWSIPEGKGASWWAYNNSSGALTTGLLIKIMAKHFGVWLRD